jgi:hypothetical protein
MSTEIENKQSQQQQQPSNTNEVLETKEDRIMRLEREQEEKGYILIVDMDEKMQIFTRQIIAKIWQTLKGGWNGKIDSSFWLKQHTRGIKIEGDEKFQNICKRQIDRYLTVWNKVHIFPVNQTDKEDIKIAFLDFKTIIYAFTDTEVRYRGFNQTELMGCAVALKELRTEPKGNGTDNKKNKKDKKNKNKKVQQKPSKKHINFSVLYMDSD